MADRGTARARGRANAPGQTEKMHRFVDADGNTHDANMNWFHSEGQEKGFRPLGVLDENGNVIPDDNEGSDQAS